MKILSLSSVFPNAQEPGLGLFVSARIQKMAELAEVKVVAPLPILDYSHPHKRFLPRRDIRSLGQDDFEVLRPGWIFPPGGTPINVASLALRLLPMLRRLRKQFPFEIIDAHFGYPEGAAAAILGWALGVPFVVTLRGNEMVFARDHLRRKCLEWTLRRANSVIAVSEELRRFAIRHGSALERTHTIQNGVDTEVFYPRDRDQCRREFAISGRTKLIVCAGELIEAKGHHLAIRAVAKLARQSSEILLLVVGGVARGGRRFDAQLRGLISDLCAHDNVRMVGAVNRTRMAELMSAADLFTLPSYGEGCPNVVTEALACGTPVVATAVGAVPELVPNEEYGLIVPPRNEEALLSALGQGLAKNWDRSLISKHGGRRSWRTVAAEVIHVLEPLTPAQPVWVVPIGV
jgi:glycosyltransferase involved in cell wall biosynthesis